ncbi:hypothetical protein LTR37_018702 [Vermiconidia calcicola]|uniref:Uncharacterized protein n=1 Tax=Vermiconidia calcicola TaxID=1690605 RepID=A0ACC3MHS3_9PEZI|nr:hypothetical protein LTR37_018702 [Vermiconidia calcicola]
MASETKTLKATCLCGTAAHTLNLPSSVFPLKAYICHCNSCRHTTGALFLSIILIPESTSYEPSAELLNKLVPFQFSKRLTYYHCATCGALTLQHCWNDASDPSKGHNWDLATGSLEQADGVFEVQCHEHIADTLDGGFSDFLPSINGKSLPRWTANPDSEDLPLYWSSPSRPQITPSSSDNLHAHCKCTGVEFWISRPSERSKQAADKSCWWLQENGTKFTAGVCSCNSCRLDCGQEMIQWAFVPTVDISLDEKGEKGYEVPFGTLRAYQSSGDVTRYFCGACGATVFFTCDERKDLVDVAVGMLDAAEGARAESWLKFRTGRVSYREDAVPRAESFVLGVENGLKQFAEHQQQE